MFGFTLVFLKVGPPKMAVVWFPRKETKDLGSLESPSLFAYVRFGIVCADCQSCQKAYLFNFWPLKLQPGFKAGPTL